MWKVTGSSLSLPVNFYQYPLQFTFLYFSLFTSPPQRLLFTLENEQNNERDSSYVKTNNKENPLLNDILYLSVNNRQTC